MSFDKQIQDKFSGFEPEVPEEHIDAGWEKIRYFLPAEETKKRGFFFYWSAKGMGIAALLVLISVMGVWLMQEQEKTSSILALQRTGLAPRSVDSEFIETHHATLTQRPEKKSGSLTVESRASSVFEAKQGLPGALTQHPVKPLSPAQPDTEPSVAAGTSGNTPDRKQTESGSIKNQTPGSPLHAQNATNTGAMSAPVNGDTGRPQQSSDEAIGLMILLKQASLGQEAPFGPDPELALLSANHLDPAPSFKRRPALELFSGVSNRSIILQTEQEKKTLQANGFSAGMAGIFPLRSKLYLSGQFAFCYNPVQYHEEAGAKAIIGRKVVPSANLSLINYKDTLVYYDPYQSTFELESSAAYRLSAGAGYQLLHKGRISLEGALFLDFRYMRVNYRISRQESDTNIFVNNILTTNATSFYESVEKPDAPTPVSGKKQMVALGLNPSLCLVYQLGKRTGLIFRPAYLLQITPNSLNANAKAYRFRENNWYLNLGLRYRL